jgi:glycosyltransferase involved in cell wall biosynthesis
MKNYAVQVSEGDYVFAGGNADRDYRIFADAVRGLDIPCVIATNRPENLQGFTLPATVKAVSVNPVEFRQLMAGARLVVIPMRTGYLHAGGQQSILNAMSMGKPVVFTDEEGGSDYISHWRTGVLVPYRSVGKLRAAIKTLWNDPDQARLIGDCARNFAAPLSTQSCNDAIWKLCINKIPPQTIAVERLARVYSQGL